MKMQTGAELENQTNPQKKTSANLWFVGVYAIAMAYIESASVVYLRRVYNITDLTASISRFDPQIGSVELGRELATLIMLLAIGWTAGKHFQSRLGFTFFAFGLWDIFYYFWLKVFINWPASFLDIDILFLLPLPWWGPVLAPLLIAVLMVLGGAWAVIREEEGYKFQLKPVEWVCLVSGLVILLYTFMADALAALPADAQTLSNLKPTSFHWTIYMVGFALTANAVWRATSKRLS
ncbi:MAG: hypothetical protein WBI14_08405 [Anaerolineaceae bacterium]